MWYTEKGPERAREKPRREAVRGARRGREEKSLPRETEKGDGVAKRRRSKGERGGGVRGLAVAEDTDSGCD